MKLIKEKTVKLFCLLLYMVLWNLPHLKAQNCGNTPPSALMVWSFNLGNTSFPTTNGPIPDYNPCNFTGAALGSIAHRNTNSFANALCLAGYYSCGWANDYGQIFNRCYDWDPSATTFDPKVSLHFFTSVNVPVGKASKLTGFSIKVLQKQFNGTRVNYESQGVAVYRNGVLIYNQIKPILASNINAKAITFDFIGPEFETDGSKAVKFKVVFGLVHRLVGPSWVPSSAMVGYDDVKILGICDVDAGGTPVSSPKASATVSPTTCTAGVADNNGKITLDNFAATDKYDYSLGGSYTGSQTYATATTLPTNGVIVSNLPNPSSPQSYTVRVFNAGCYQDIPVTLQPTICPPTSCTNPTATLTPTVASCTSATPSSSNSDGKIAITGVTNGDKVGISAGSIYSGAIYANAVSLVGSNYIFTGLPNPDGSQIYTIRVFNGSDFCFKDYNVTINETLCGCKKIYAEIITSSAADPNSTPSNGITTENDMASYELCKANTFIDLALSKSVSPSTGISCPTSTPFIWTLTLQNKGTMAATNIKVANYFPSGLIYVNSSTTAGTHDERAGWMIPSLGAGQSATLTITTQAIKAGNFSLCSEVSLVTQTNDPNSTPDNGIITEDDYACQSITVTGNNSPTISKGFSPMLTKPNIPTRLVIKITNNEATPIALTSDFVDNLPSSPAQMVIASTPNLNTNLTSVVAIAGGTKVTIPSGAILLPGLNQIEVDITVPAEGNYCNSIAAGVLQTNVCNNLEGVSVCMTADNNFVMAPLLKKSFSPTTIQTNTNSSLTITIENRDTQNFTLNQDFIDKLPSGLIIAGATSGTCPNISTFGSTDQVGITAGAVIPTGSCTIVVPVKSAIAGTYCNTILMNELLGTIGANENVGNEDIAQACLTVIATPCTAIDLTSITQSPVGVITVGSTVSLTAIGTGIDGTKTALNWLSNPLAGTLKVQGNVATWITPNTAGTYSIKVVGNNTLTGYGACKDSTTINITVALACTKPVIVVTPKNQTICAGSPASAYTISPSTGVEYTWYGPLADTTSNFGTAIAGQTLASFTPSGTALTTTGIKYYAVVVNNTGDVTCADTAFVQLVVNEKPTIADGTATICAGATVDLTSRITSYGTYLSPVWTVATASGSAVTTPTTVKPTATTTYVLVAQNALGCRDTANVVVTVNAKPVIADGTATICAGESVDLTSKITSYATYLSPVWTVATAGGTAASTPTAVKPAVTTTYVLVAQNAAGCQDTANVLVTVNVKPVIADGTATICAGESVDLTSKITSYATYLNPVWTVATAGGTAVTTPTAVKPAVTTTYVLVAQNAAGCQDTANVVVTVNPKPNAGPDQTLACANAATNTLTTTTNLVPSLTGGTWVQIGATPTIATVAGNTVWSMTVAGTYQFEYTLNGCKDTVAVTVEPCEGCVKPNAGSDAMVICQPMSTAKLTAITAGGSWSPIGNLANPLAATIDASGNITGMTAAGTYKFVYSVTSGGQTCTDTAQVVVNAKPVIVDGTAIICAGESVDLTSKVTNYATYLSPVWTIATAGGSAVSTPTTVKPTATTTYILVAQNALGCKDTANVVVTVNAKPNAGTDQTLACANETTNILTTSTTLVPVTTGGTFTQIGTTLAVANIAGNAVSNMTVAGTYQFQYSVLGCLDTVAVTVQPCSGCAKPNAGPDAAAVCQPTRIAKLTAVTSGGTWAAQAGNPATATIDNNGSISGLSTAGTYKFIYSVTGGGITCTDTAQVVVNAKPLIADGTATICSGESVDLTSKITGYATYLSPVWTVATAGGAAVSTPTTVKPTATTTYVLVAQNALGCKDTANVVVTVNAKPNAGTDQTLACANAITNILTTSTTLVPVTTGGTFTQIGTIPAVANIAGNAVSNMTVAGTYQFQYAVAGCLDTVAVSVQPCSGCVKPNAGPDAAAVCQSTTTAKLTAVTSGGTWAAIGNPANPAAATIDASGNIVGMTAVGVYKFVYSVTGGGQTCTDTAQVVVNAKPTITVVNGFPSCRANGSAYSIKFVATGGTVITVPTLTVIGDSIANIPLTTTSVKLIITSPAGCKDTVTVAAPVCDKPVGSIGDLIWKDVNDNGLQDLPTEKGVAGVKVNLYAASGGTKTGAILQTKTTGNDGLYFFTGLLAGDYIVEIDKTTLKDTCAITTKQNIPGDDTKDSDFNPTTGLSQVITLNPVFNPTTEAELVATNNLTVDAGLVKVILCIKPNLAIGAVACNGNATYSVSLSASGGSVSSNAGSVNGNMITGIPVGTNVEVTVSAGLGCSTVMTVQSPSDCSFGNNCSLPLLGVGQPICNGTTYSVAYVVINGSVTTNAGMVSGNAVVGIPLGTDVIITASNSLTCTSKVEVKSPTDCVSNCSNARISVSLPVCEANNASTYSVNYVALSGTTLTANVGTIGTSSITGIPSGSSLILTIKKPSCSDHTVSIGGINCLSCVKPKWTVTAAPTCAANLQTYSVSFSVTGKNGFIKASAGTLTNPSAGNYTVTGIPNATNLKITDSLSAVCKFDTTIVGSNCNCNPPLPVLLTGSVTACAGDTFPTIKATVIGLATVEWFTQATGGAAIFTGLNYKPSTTVPTTGAVFYAQARSTDPTCPTAISTRRVMATVNAQDCTKEVDLALKKSINTKIAQIGDELTYTIKVFNQLNVAATSVEVIDSIATSVQFVAGSFVASRGSAIITGNVIKWNIGGIAAAGVPANAGANGDTVTLSYKVKATQEGVHFNTAEISKTNEKDKDSTPGNGKDSEDDIDHQCFSVPIKLCTGAKVEASVSTKYTNVQWFKDGGSMPIASGNVVLLSGVGIYTYTASNQTCPSGGCCPIIIENSTNCCPVEKCIPLTIKKIKK